MCPLRLEKIYEDPALTTIWTFILVFWILILYNVWSDEIERQKQVGTSLKSDYHLVGIVNGQKTCAGISDGFKVFTVAHCVITDNPDSIQVLPFPFKYTENDEPVFEKVDQIKIQKGFNNSTLVNDFAIVTLKTRHNSTGFKLKLAQENRAIFNKRSNSTGIILSIMNFDKTKTQCPDGFGGEIKKKTVTLVDIEECSNKFNFNYRRETVFCGKSDQGPYKGESGSPLLIHDAIVGLVSGGEELEDCSDGKEVLTTFVNIVRMLN